MLDKETLRSNFILLECTSLHNGFVHFLQAAFLRDDISEALQNAFSVFILQFFNWVNGLQGPRSWTELNLQSLKNQPNKTCQAVSHDTRIK